MPSKYKSKAMAISVDDAVGTVIAHDITEIRPCHYFRHDPSARSGGERIQREDMAAMAHGGMCLDCERCQYPNGPFGK